MIQEKYIEWCGKAATICKQKLNIRISLFCCILFGRSRKQNLKTIVRCHIGICEYFSISRSECTLDSGLLSFFLACSGWTFLHSFPWRFLQVIFFYIRFHIFIVLLLGILFLWVFEEICLCDNVLQWIGHTEPISPFCVFILFCFFFHFKINVKYILS